MKTLIRLVSLLATISSAAHASSHREAPAISKDPALDITDVYVFRAPEDSSKVNIIMNVSPAYQSYAGPNWYGFEDNAIYEMHIDTTGDAIEDITYRFKFKTNDYKATEGLIVANFPAVEFKDGKYSGSLSQTYSVFKVLGPRHKGRQQQIAKDVPVAPPRIGPATTDGGLQNADDPAAMYNAYKELASKAITTTQSGVTLFAGPRNDPFFVDLGGVFDRVSVRIPGVTGTPRDALAGSNVLTIALQMPASEWPEACNNFGVWASTSRPQATVLKNKGASPQVAGPWVQVSRLGNPLVNEVVIKMKDKDKFNNTEPKDDAANYAGYVVEPQLAYVLNVLYGPNGLTAPNFISPIDEKNRTDLVAAFVDGLPGINRHPKAKQNAGDMIRVNLSLPAALQEWPLSGRQLKDDVVKSALVFLAQCKKLTGNTAQPDNPFGKYETTTANCALDDFVTADDKTPGGNGQSNQFPYLDLPFSAYGKKN